MPKPNQNQTNKLPIKYIPANESTLMKNYDIN